jgi:predicted phosphodiesterase
MNRIAVVSDIHGNVPALEAVVTDIRRHGPERIINLGDHISGPLWPAETLAELMGRDWIHIRGNHDRAVGATPPERLGPSDRFAYEQIGEAGREWLRTLPPAVRLEGGLTLCHGTPEADDLYLLETVCRGRVMPSSPAEIAVRLGGERAALMLCGHSHLPSLIDGPGNGLMVNPGSVGLPAYDDVLPEPHLVEAGSPHARYAFLRREGERWTVEHVAVPYDHDAAADRARENGRPDWEIALRTGRMS